MTFVVDDLVRMAEEFLDKEISPPETRLALSDVGFDSLAITLLTLALEERFPFLTIPATEGLIDPSWSLVDLHHFVAAEVERYDGPHS